MDTGIAVISRSERSALSCPSYFSCKHTQIAIGGKRAEACLVCASPLKLTHPLIQIRWISFFITCGIFAYVLNSKPVFHTERVYAYATKYLVLAFSEVTCPQQDVMPYERKQLECAENALKHRYVYRFSDILFIRFHLKRP